MKVLLDDKTRQFRADQPYRSRRRRRAECFEPFVVGRLRVFGRMNAKVHLGAGDHATMVLCGPLTIAEKVIVRRIWNEDTT
jgi:hypothetical protein